MLPEGWIRDTKNNIHTLFFFHGLHQHQIAARARFPKYTARSIENNKDTNKKT